MPSHPRKALAGLNLFRKTEKLRNRSPAPTRPRWRAWVSLYPHNSYGSFRPGFAEGRKTRFLSDSGEAGFFVDNISGG
jgi:hypothetical protein